MLLKPVIEINIFLTVMKTVLNKNGENKARLFNKTINVFLQIQGGYHYAFLSTLTSPHVNRRRTFQLSNVRM